MTNIVDVFL